MTTSDFLSELSEIRGQFSWALRLDTGLHADRRATPRLQIRGTPNGEATAPSLDPLRAVCYARTGKVFDYGAWSEIADALNIDLSAAAVVLAAANDRTWAGVGEPRAPAEHLLIIRKELLKAVGLSEPDRV